MSQMPAALEKVRDELAQRQFPCRNAIETKDGNNIYCGKFDHKCDACCDGDIHKRGFNACFETLCSMGGEFDQDAALVEMKRLVTLFEANPEKSQLFRRMEDMARWQHAQCASVIAALRAGLKMERDAHEMTAQDFEELKASHLKNIEQLDHASNLLTTYVLENEKLRAELAAAQARIAELEAALKSINVQQIVNGKAGQELRATEISELLAKGKK